MDGASALIIDMNTPGGLLHVTPDELSAPVPGGTTLLEALATLGVHLTAPCGGEGTCGKCRVLAKGALSPLTAAELDRLGPEEMEAGFRLACQARLEGDVEVEVPPVSRRPEMRILVSGSTRRAELDPENQTTV